MTRSAALLGALALLLAAAPASAASSLPTIVRAAARAEGVPERLALGLVRVESGFRPHAVSRDRAMGLTQVEPATARSIGCRGSLIEPAANVRCGMRYLRLLIGQARGDVALALRAYNVGPAACRRHARAGRRYAARVLAAARAF